MNSPGTTVLYTAPANEFGFIPHPRMAQPARAGDNQGQSAPPREVYTPRTALEERVRSGPSGIILPALLPFLDDKTGETPAMRLAYRKMANDPDVKASLLAKIFGVLGLDMEIMPFDEDNERDKEVAEFVSYSLEERIAGGLPGLLWEIVYPYLIDGYCICEKVWELESPDISSRWAWKWILRALKAKDTNNDVVPDIDEFRNIVGVKALRYNRGEVFDPTDFLIASHLPLFGNPGGTSDLRAAYGSYWMLDTCTKLRAMGVEKRAHPLLKGEYELDTQKSTLESALALAKSRNWMVVPKGVQVEAIEIAGRSEDMFKSFTQDMRERIHIGIEGATLQSLTGAKGTQRGNSQVHKDTADLRKWHLANVLLALLNHPKQGLIRDVVNRNYAKPVNYPVATLGGVDDNELSETQKVWSAALKDGLPLSRKQYYKKFSLPPPKDDGDALNPPSPSPRPQNGPGGASGQAFDAGADPVNVTTQPANPLFIKGKHADPAPAVAAATPFRFAEEWAEYLSTIEGQE